MYTVRKTAVNTKKNLFYKIPHWHTTPMDWLPFRIADAESQMRIARHYRIFQNFKNVF